MYELDYTPKRFENFNDYFVCYKETHDVRYFNEFLYFYETTLERNICNFCQQYGLEDNRKEDWMEKIHKLQTLKEEINELNEIFEHRYYNTRINKNINNRLIIKAERMLYQLINRINILIEELKEEDNESILRRMFPNEEDREIDIF